MHSERRSPLSTQAEQNTSGGLGQDPVGAPGHAELCARPVGGPGDRPVLTHQREAKGPPSSGWEEVTLTNVGLRPGTAGPLARQGERPEGSVGVTGVGGFALCLATGIGCCFCHTWAGGLLVSGGQVTEVSRPGRSLPTRGTQG